MNNINEVGYNGNPLLKKTNTPIPWTQEQIDEYIKCKDDPEYFAEKYIKIITEDGFEVIELYDYQKEIIDKFDKNKKLAVLQARQSGKTTTAVCIILHYILFNDHKLVGILANKADSAREVLKRIKDAYEALPPWLQQGIEKWNEGSIELENKTKVIAAATSSSAIRGRTCQFLYIDECVGAESHVCIESQNHFYYTEIKNLTTVDYTKEFRDNIIEVTYKTINIINNKEYVGVYKVNSRKEIICDSTEYGSVFKDGYLGSGSRIKNDIIKYKPESFRQEILSVSERIIKNSNIKTTLEKVKILGSKDFVNFDGFEKTGVKKSLKISFSNGSSFTCSENHAVMLNDGWSLARELIVGDFLNGKIISKIENNGEIETYSPMSVGTDFTYYASGFYNHNCAFIPKWDEFSASVLPTISAGKKTKLMYTSTPKGLNHYYKICSGAKEGTNGFGYVEVHWTDVPGRDEAWRVNALEELNGDQELFAQEYCCEFMGSSGTLINGNTLKALVSKTYIHSQDGLTQYVGPDDKRIYAIVCDVSQGKGLDYSAFQVIDVTSMPYNQVCVYRDNMVTPYDYAGIIHMTSKAYNNATILVEVNDAGGQVAEALHMDYGSENMIFTESAGAAGKRISSGFGKNVDKGIRTSTKVKAVGCSMLKLLLEQQQLIINDFDTIEELSRFSKKGNSYEAESGSHDDLVMPLVLFGWMTDQTYFKDMTDINTLHKLRDRSDEELEQSLTGFGFINNGLEDEIESIIDLTKNPNPDFINF